MSKAVVVGKLKTARVEFCGIGTRKTKLRLNKLAASSPLAKAYRTALEIEDASTSAKRYYAYRFEHYERKQQLIHDLIELCREHGWQFGKHKSDSFETKWIVYFDLPDCEQISFHCNLETDVSDYTKAWDGKCGSTLDKLEAAISQLFGSPETPVFQPYQLPLEL